LISYIIPTHDRPEQLALTLSVIGRLSRADHERAPGNGGAEVIVVDNASRFVPIVPKRLANGVPVHLVLRGKNDGAAARNVAARHASGDWLVMLDDDSHPMDAGFVDTLAGAAPDVAAVGAEIFLPSGARESGGLPEVFIGCGVAIRREVFLDPNLGVGPGGPLLFNGAGYDPSFNYYAEEYDLAARMILGGWRVVHSSAFRVLHHKVSSGRDMDAILRRLVRNNAWVEQRYAPEDERRAAIQRLVSRYRVIAEKESALRGYQLGLGDLDDTLDDQPRAEMTRAQYDRFTGLAAARETLGVRLRALGMPRLAVVEPGKNEWVVRRALSEVGVEVVQRPEDAGALVVGTMSPGPMLDAAERWGSGSVSVISPWDMEAALAVRALAA
jgi:GT2 family glycosyltransferase